MKVEINKRYKLRNGLETGLIRKANNGTNYIFDADVQEPEHKTPSILSWKKNGRFLTDDIDNRFDIIEEL